MTVALPAWIQHAQGKTDLAAGSGIIDGDRVITGDNGRIEFELWSGTRLRVYSDSEISFSKAPGAGAAEDPPVLKLHRGRICLESPPPSVRGNNFKLNLDGLLQAMIQQYGHICASRREDLSVINLRAGNVQINNEVDPGIVILSEAGTVFQMDDEGAYQLLSLVDESEVADMHQQPFITAQEAAQPVADTQSDTEQDVTEETESSVQILSGEDQTVTSEPAAEAATSAGGYVYTVYLFSTRSEEVAESVNRKFQQAGHETRILVREDEDPIRYRIAVSGFESRQSASEFADSIVGKMGIRDTWIGKDNLLVTPLKADKAVTEANPEKEKSPQTAATTQEPDNDVKTETVKPDTEPTTSTNDFIYTVYLFSTRSEETANQVNNKFQRAGHDTRILINTKEDPIRYRIVVTGFESRQSASLFADSIVGKLGIRDTWIGKDRATTKD